MKGTRIPVSIIVGSIADGMTIEQVCAGYPQLSRDDVLAALSYAAEVLRQEVILPMAGQEVSLQVKVDEDLPSHVAELLRGAGHGVETVVGQGMGGAKDRVLWRAVQAEGRFLITADKGFGDIRAYPPGTHVGILLLRPDEDGVDPLVELIRRVLRAGNLDHLRGTVTVASPRGIRIRKP